MAELEPVAWRYRYLYPGRKNHWIVRQSPIYPSAASPGFVEIEVEPLFTRPPASGVAEELREAAFKAGMDTWLNEDTARLPIEAAVNATVTAMLNALAHPATAAEGEYTSNQFGAGYVKLIELGEEWGLHWTDPTPGQLLTEVLRAMGFERLPAPPAFASGDRG